MIGFRVLLAICNLDISTISDISQIIIALINLFFAGYVIFYQRNKDHNDSLDSKNLFNQKLRLQKFNELIIEPFKKGFDNYISKLLEEKIIGLDYSEEFKASLLQIVKSETRKLTKNFIDVLFIIDQKTYYEFKDQIDGFYDEIANNINQYNLSNSDLFNTYYENVIYNHKYKLIAIIFNYSGTNK